jgi:hypothetical protein
MDLLVSGKARRRIGCGQFPVLVRPLQALEGRRFSIRRLGTMIWFYERRGDHLRCEIRTQIEGDRFDLLITHPDGTESVETFGNQRVLNQRTAELERLWRAEGWDGPFSRDW